MGMIEPALAAWMVAGLLSVIALFQIALAAGAPWGELAMGGRYPGRFPAPMRIAALVQTGVYAAMAAVLLIRAGVIWPERAADMQIAAYVVTGVMALALVLNLITPSRWERRIWAPVALLMLLGAARVAFG